MTAYWRYNQVMYKFTLRMNEELHEKLKKLAEEEHRSMQSQMIYMLEKYLEQMEEKKKQG